MRGILLAFSSLLEAYMAQQDEQPRPHGDPLRDEVERNSNPEENRAQRDSDAPPDASMEPTGDISRMSDRGEGQGSDANGVPAFDEAAGDLRKKQYESGAEIVSRID
jgi:hypothetical protein